MALMNFLRGRNTPENKKAAFPFGFAAGLRPCAVLAILLSDSRARLAGPLLRIEEAVSKSETVIKIQAQGVS
jgi:hypothetical protein